MSSIHILKGANEGTLVPLDGERFVIGRDPECGIVIPVTSVSRKHAIIVRQHGAFYIEDNQSRNGTAVNDKAITGRTPLKNNDKIRICDNVFAFLEQPPPDDDADDPDSTSTVEAMLSHSSNLLLESQPAEKLRLLLEISGNLSKTLELDALLPKIVDSLFSLFRQADRCFIIQAEEAGERAPAGDRTPAGKRRLLPRVVKTRRPQDETNARFSKSIVGRCLDTAQAFLSDDASRDDRIQLSQSVVDFRIRSVMCVPLCDANGKAFGVIQLDTQDRTKKFTQDDLKLLWGVANQAAIALDNARMHAEAVSRERLRRDLELAHRVQLSFLPAKLPQVAGYEFYAHYEPANEVGGDYYGFVPLTDGRLAFAVGDVAGKGVSAALLMAKLSSDSRLSLLTEPDLGRAVAKLNGLLYEFTSPLDRFVTLTAAVLDPARHVVTLVCAGHPSPLLHRRGGGTPADAVPRDVSGRALGFLEDETFETCEVALAPGECLVLFTDGLTDAQDVRQQPFSHDGVLRVVREHGALGARGLGERLIKAVQQHAAGQPPFDDLTLVCLGRTA
jgi:serine phosphatase RsbU (regulator of sigma subunit)/pSer/pThr/pTyr-binding forkhead associated (FHA) protein